MREERLSDHDFDIAVAFQSFTDARRVPRATFCNDERRCAQPCGQSLQALHLYVTWTGTAAIKRGFQGIAVSPSLTPARSASWGLNEKTRSDRGLGRETSILCDPDVTAAQIRVDDDQ